MQAQEELVKNNFCEQMTSDIGSAAFVSQDTVIMVLCKHCNTLKSTGKGQAQGKA